MKSGSGGPARTQVRLTQETKDVLDQIRASSNTANAAAVIKKSLALLQFASGQKKSDNLLFIYDPKDGSFKQLLINRDSSNPEGISLPILIPAHEARANAAAYASVLVTAVTSLIQETSHRLDNTFDRSQRLQDDEGLTSLLKSLLLQLRKLNKTLNSNLPLKPISQRDKVQLSNHINKFLDGFAGVAGKGTGALVVAASASLLTYIGATPGIVSSILTRLR